MKPAAKTTLSEVCSSVRYGYTASASEEACGPKFLRITDIVPESLDWDRVPYCEISDDHKEKFGLEIDDIVVARTGATVGYAKQIRENVEAVFASYLVRFRVDPTKAEPRYIGKLVESVAYKAFVQSRIGGAAQPNASAPVLGAFAFHLPPRSSQEQAAKILSTYDDLIENNRRRMALLEESARLLYREWFVRMRFPGYEHTPIVDGLPQGWERKTLGDSITLNYGKALKAEMRVEGEYPVYGSSGIVGTHEKPLVQGPAIILGRKGNVGSVYWSSKSFFPIDTVYFVSPESSSLYLFYALKNMHFISTDVAVPGLNRDFAYSRPLFHPPPTLLRSFHESVELLHAQLDKLEETNQKLRAARDLLLPRLMSGELSV